MRKLCVIFLLSACAVFNARAQGPQVTIANGKVEGVVDAATGIRMFKGIPFAQPPVGDLRWKEPQPVKNWDGVLKADHFGRYAVSFLGYE